MAQGGVDVPVDEVVQLVGWHLLRHCFCGTSSEVNWREMLKGGREASMEKTMKHTCIKVARLTMFLWQRW